MDVLTAIKERRSCRTFLPDALDEASVEMIIESAVWAPSPANNQPWEFIVVMNPDVKRKIHEDVLACKQRI